MDRTTYHTENIGKKFGRLTVKSWEKKIQPNKQLYYYYNCECECGNKCDVRAFAVLSGRTRSCGCLQSEKAKNHAQIMGYGNRKHDETCSYCGKPEHYSLGYCRICYNRLRRTGNVEKKELLQKKKIKLTSEQNQKVLDFINAHKKEITANKVLNLTTVLRWNELNKVVRTSTLPKLYEYFNLDIYEELNIDEEHKNKKRYKF